MAFWDKIFRKPEKNISHKWENILSGITPIYTSDFGTDIYASDVVQQAIFAIVSELKKLDPVHVRTIESDFAPVSGNIQNILNNPNPLMTTSDFIEKIIWNLLLNYNSFVYPLWEGNRLVGLYPLQPSNVEFDNDYNGSGKTWVRFTFPNGYIGDVPYENIIHLKYRYSKSDYMGGDIDGQPDFEPLLDTLKLNDTLLKGLAKSLNIQTSINGVVKLKTMQNTGDQISKVKEFEDKLKANESGLLPIDISAEYIPITKQVQLLDATTLEFIDKKILRTFGVSIPIIDGDYTREQYEAFYQKTLEPIIKSLGQAFTKGIFTNRETQGFDNRIVFYVKELIFLNTDQKLALFTELGNRGACYENEFRVAFGLRPLAELQGVRMQSLNYVNTDYAQEYQTGTNGGTDEKNGTTDDDKKQEEEQEKDSGGVDDE